MEMTLEVEAQDHFELEYESDHEGIVALKAEAPVLTQKECPLLPVDI